MDYRFVNFNCVGGGVLGNIVITVFLMIIRRWAKCDDETYGKFENEYYQKNSPQITGYKVEPIPPWLQGAIEQLFFIVLVARDISGYPTAMMAWLAVKMLTNLNRADRLKGEIVVARALTGLMGALSPMFFALLGGLACQKITIPILMNLFAK